MSGLPELGGKVAVVTGGASGIGKGIATQLIAEGARVIIADIQRDALAASAAEIGAALAVPVDVSDPASVDALADQVLETFGTVHVVCNNAGIGPLAPIADLTLDDWRWMIGVNLWGVIHGVHTFLPILKRNRDGGHIVNTASMAGPMRVSRTSTSSSRTTRGTGGSTRWTPGPWWSGRSSAATCTRSPTRTGIPWSPSGTRPSPRRSASSRRPSGSSPDLRRSRTRGRHDARHDRLLRPADASPGGGAARLHHVAAGRQASDDLQHARGRRRLLPRPRGVRPGRRGHRCPRFLRPRRGSRVLRRRGTGTGPLAHRLRGDRAAQQPRRPGQQPGGRASRRHHLHRGLRARRLQRRGCHGHLRRNIPAAAAAERLRHRYSVFNVWRAFSGPPQDVALALCDTRSVAPRDKQYCEITMRSASGELLTWENITYYHSEAHRWWHCPDMTRDEAYVFRSFDSAPGHAEQVPHSAFVNESCPASAPPRASVEVRVFAFYAD